MNEMKNNVKIVATQEDRYYDQDLNIEKIEEGIIAKEFKKKDDFVKFFVENIEELNHLTGNEIKVLLICIKFMGYHNVVVIDSNLRKKISAISNISLPAISRHLKTLVEKQILVKLEPNNLPQETKDILGIADFETKNYLVNPNIIGKGSFRDLSLVRRITIKDFDFQELKFKKRVRIQRSYEDIKNLDLSDYEVKRINKISNENKEQTIVTIEEKKQNQIQELENLFDESDSKAVFLSEEISKLIVKEKEAFMDKIKRLENLVEKVQLKLVEENEIEKSIDLKKIY
ncbi:hypothetical protein GMI15_09270, partial [Campylobacter coli]|nr:hypothetical protein [Campylobacter coli]HBK1694460.1 hypothetical protein [Campylobacter coli]